MLRITPKKLLLAGLVLVGGGLLYADTPHRPQTRVWRGQPQGLDQTVGKVWFRIRHSSGDKVLMTPLIPVDLLMARTRGEDNPPDALVECTVVKRTIIFSETNLTAITVTVAECPNNREYAVETVIFDLDRRAKDSAPHPAAILQ